MEAYMYEVSFSSGMRMRQDIFPFKLIIINQ